MGKKIFWIALISIVLCTLFVSVTESVLRLAGYGEPRSLFLYRSDGLEPHYIVNPAFYAHFFPKDIRENFRNTLNWGWAIPAVKSANSFRIFVFGGSVAAGDVPDNAFNFSRILECMLRSAYPTVTFEIYNLACVALNSHVMRAAAREAALLKPDLFVVYMGHNEYIAWATTPVSPHSIIIQLRMALQNLRLIQIAGFQPMHNPSNASEFFERSVKLPQGTPGRERLYKNYHCNLAAICRSANKGGAAVVFCTLGCNLRDVPPFYPLHRSGLSDEQMEQWEELFREGLAAADPNANSYDMQRAVSFFERCMKIDPDHAELNYQLALCLMHLGRYDEARHYFARARDYDAFFIRADSRINALVRQTAENRSSQDIIFADTEKDFIAESPNGIMGNDIFYDAVHVLFRGNYIIASSVFNSITALVASKTGLPVNQEILSIEACKQRLGLSPYLDIQHVKDALEELERYREFHPRIDSSFLRERISELEKHVGEQAFDEALCRLDAALEFWGDDFYIRRVKALLLKRAGRDEEARLVVEQITKSYPNWPAAQKLKQFIVQH